MACRAIEVAAQEPNLTLWVRALLGVLLADFQFYHRENFLIAF